jgi:hypothetical protein
MSPTHPLNRRLCSCECLEKGQVRFATTYVQDSALETSRMCSRRIFGQDVSEEDVESLDAGLRFRPSWEGQVERFLWVTEVPKVPEIDRGDPLESDNVELPSPVPVRLAVLEEPELTRQGCQSQLRNLVQREGE